MHPEEKALLKSVCWNPADDAPRLVYADWLDEHNREEQAEFIRTQIACPSYFVVLWKDLDSRRVRNLWTTSPYQRMPKRFSSDGLLPILRGIAKKSLPIDRFSGLSSNLWMSVEFRRGFIAKVTLSHDVFFLVHKPLFELSPVTEVSLNDKRPAMGYRDPRGEKPMPVYWWYSEKMLLVSGVSAISDRLVFNSEIGLYHDERLAYKMLNDGCIRYGRKEADLPQLPTS